MTVTKPIADFARFEELDIRIGRIVAVEAFPRARQPAYKVAVDLGAIGTKWSSAQIIHYAPDAIMGTMVTCICNLKPRNIAGFHSEILILGARDEHGNVILVSPRQDIPPGSPLF